MLNNAKVDPLMRQIMDEVESGDSIYTKAQEEEIKAILYEGITKGKNFDRIYRERLEKEYPLPKGPGLVNSHIRLRQLYADMAQLYKKHVNIDKEILFEQVYTRMEEIYYQEADKHDIDGQRKTLAQLKDLLRYALQYKALEQADKSEGETRYVLDFNI